MIIETDEHIKESITKKIPLTPEILETYGFKEKTSTSLKLDFTWVLDKGDGNSIKLDLYRKDENRYEFKGIIYVNPYSYNRAYYITNVEQLEAYLLLHEMACELRENINETTESMRDIATKSNMRYTL